MDTNVNKISQAYTSYQTNKVGEKPEGKAQQKEDSKPQIERKEVSANETLNFMTAQNIGLKPVVPPKVLNISKYNTPEQEARIRADAQKYEENFEKTSEKIDNELGKSVSDKAKKELALAVINNDMGVPEIDEKQAKESALVERVTASMLNFFMPKMEAYFKGINVEVGNALSDEAKMDLAIDMFNVKYM